MKTTLFQLSRFFLVVGLFSVTASLVNAQKTATDNNRQMLIDNSLLRYREISALPTSERRRFFNNLSATDKSNIWRVHLALYLVKHPELNQVQKEFVLDTMFKAMPEFFETPRDDSTRRTRDEQIQSLTRRALEVLPKKEAYEVLENLGGGEIELSLLQKYSNVSSLSMRQRRILFRDATTNNKSDLWRTHLVIYLVKHPELNKNQGDIILQAVSIVTPELFSIEQDSFVWNTMVAEPIQLLRKRVIEVFSVSNATEILEGLGGKEPNSPDVIEINLLKTKTNHRQQYPDCECSTNWSICTCISEVNLCTETQTGCGPFWAFPCNRKKCKDSEIN